MEMGSLQINGGELEYFSFGSGKRKLVVLPGISVRSVLFSAAAVESSYRLFKDEFTLYIIDRRSDLPDSCTIKEIARDTAQAINALGLEKVSVFGASMGGMIALQLALDYPRLVSEMVLGSTSARNNDTVISVAQEWIELAQKGDTDALSQSFIRLLYSESTKQKYAAALARMNEDVTREQLRRFVAQTKAIKKFDLSGRLKEIKTPAFVIGVEGDQVVTAQASKEIAEGLNCELYMYGSEYGHCVFDEAEDYKQRILDFLLKYPE